MKKSLNFNTQNAIDSLQSMYDKVSIMVENLDKCDTVDKTDFVDISIDEIMVNRTLKILKGMLDISLAQLANFQSVVRQIEEQENAL